MNRIVYGALFMSMAVLVAPLFAGDTQILIDSPWNTQTASLANGIPVSKQVKESVLQSLAKWDPDQCGLEWQIPMTVRDRYLEDDTVRDTVRAHFLPRLMKRCYEMSTGVSLADINLDTLSHSVAAGFIVLKEIHKVPYLLSTLVNDGFSSYLYKSLDLKSYGTSGCAAMSHGCAIAAGVSANPLCAAGALAFGCGAVYLSCKDDFADVVLRSFKRYYKKVGKEEELALIENMIAKKRLLATKEKNG